MRCQCIRQSLVSPRRFARAAGRIIVARICRATIKAWSVALFGLFEDVIDLPAPSVRICRPDLILPCVTTRLVTFYVGGEPGSQKSLGGLIDPLRRVRRNAKVRTRFCKDLTLGDECKLDTWDVAHEEGIIVKVFDWLHLQ